MPAVGGGAPYMLSPNAQKGIATCQDKTNMIVPLLPCLNAATYSSYFKLATNRVISK